MKTYKANNNTNSSMHKRVHKVHKKAKFVGVLYFLGSLIMLALACLPTLTLEGEALWVKSFYKAFMNGFGKDNFANIIISALYLLVLLVAIINFLRSFGKLGNLLRKNHTKVGRIKQNMQAMDDMGKLFSGSFAAIIMFHFLIYILSPLETAKLATLEDALNIAIAIPLAYATLGAGLFIHFFAGIIHGKVSNFHIGGQVAQIVEEKRENGVFVFFVRNLIQVAAVAAMVYFFVGVANLSDKISNVSGLMNDIMGGLAPFALNALTALFMLVMIKHATATTEFNLYGMRASGMKNFRIFAFFATFTAGAALALPILSGGEFAINGYAYVAGIAFVAFLLDCIIKPRTPKENKNEEEEDEVYPEEYLNGQVAPMVQPAEKGKKAKKESKVEQPVQPYPPMYPYPTMPQPQVVQQPAMQSRNAYPVYIPVYYPMPQQNNMVAGNCAKQPVCCPATVCPILAKTPCEALKKPEPQPAPAYIKATPAPATNEVEGTVANTKKGKKISKKLNKKALKLKKKQEKLAKKQAKKAKSVELESPKSVTPVAPVNPVAPATPAPAENNVKLGVADMEKNVLPQVDLEDTKGESKLDPKKQWKVRCPRCGKLLMVREVSPYHRCPSCDKVFEIRKFETYAKKN